MAELLSIQKFDSPPGQWAARAQIIANDQKDGKNNKLWAASPVSQAYDMGTIENDAGVENSPSKGDFHTLLTPVTVEWKNICLTTSGGKFKWSW